MKNSIMDFKKINVSDVSQLSELRKKFGTAMTAYSPQALYTWQEQMDLTISLNNGGFFVRKGEKSYFYPVCEENDKRRFINKISNETLTYLTNENVTELEAIFPGEFVFTYAADDAEYVYNREALILHCGSKYANFRRKLNKCERAYQLSPRLIGKADTQSMKEILQSWNSSYGIDDYGDSIPTTLAIESYFSLGFRGILLEDNTKPAAFIFGYENNAEMFTVSFMKNLPEYHESISASCIHYLAQALDGYKYLNFEEDCGIPGIRTMKQLLGPEYMLGSYNAARKKKYD